MAHGLHTVADEAALDELHDEWQEPAPVPRGGDMPRRAPPQLGRSEVRLVTGVPWRRVGWALGLALGLVAAVLIAAQVRSLTIPLLVGFIVAYLLNPLVDWLERHGASRSAAVAVVFVAIGLALLALGLAVVPRLLAEARQLPAAIEQLLLRVAPELEERFGVHVPRNLAEALSSLQARLQADGTTLSSERLLRLLFGGTVSVIGALLGLAMVPVFTFFLLRDFHALTARVDSLVPPARRGTVATIFRTYDSMMSGFVRGQLVVASILAVFYSVGLLLIGTPLALLVGIVSGVGNLVPYFGTLLGLGLATLLTLLHWHGPLQLVLVYGVFVLAQMLESWVITPKVVGDRVGLPPVWVLVSVLVFGELFGFFGILVAVPLAAALKILLLFGLDRYRASPLYAGER